MDPPKMSGQQVKKLFFKQVCSLSSANVLYDVIAGSDGDLKAIFYFWLTESAGSRFRIRAEGRYS